MRKTTIKISGSHPIKGQAMSKEELKRQTKFEELLSKVPWYIRLKVRLENILWSLWDKLKNE